MDRSFGDAQEVIEHLESLRDLPSDEGGPFTELEHALQTAAVLEAAYPDDVELQIAGLLHDLARPWDDADQSLHHQLGAEAVRPLYGDRVATLVEGHVPAKRYLIGVDAEYRRALSSTSTTTLAAQGGGFTPAEEGAFAARPDRDELVALRRADDGAKIPGLQVPDLDHWEPLLRSLAVH